MNIFNNKPSRIKGTSIPANPYYLETHQMKKPAFAEKTESETIARNAHMIEKSGSVVVYGEQGSGKTSHAARIAEILGMKHVIDDYVPVYPLPHLKRKTLLLTNVDLPGIPHIYEVLVQGISPRSSDPLKSGGA